MQSLHFFYGKGEDGRMIVHKGTRPLFTQRLRLRRFTADDEVYGMTRSEWETLQ